MTHYELVFLPSFCFLPLSNFFYYFFAYGLLELDKQKSFRFLFVTQT
ncbi:unnamed protein product [Amoebophrya sp. A120]|nr:unnamed protein product [Amoebophrya sp. A120]|eukprot:GSA120T00015872001.1